MYWGEAGTKASPEPDLTVMSPGDAPRLDRRSMPHRRGCLPRLEYSPVILTQFCCAREAAGHKASGEARCGTSGEADNAADAPRGSTRRDRPYWARAASSTLSVAVDTLRGTFLALTQYGSARMGQYDRRRLYDLRVRRLLALRPSPIFFAKADRCLA